MSKKKRRNALKAEALIETGLTEGIKNSEFRGKTNLTTASQKNETTGVIGKLNLSYLKQHWLVVGIIVFLSLGAFGAGLKYLEDDAKRQLQNGQLTSDNKSLFNRINPFLPMPSPTPTPQLSKEYLYAGSKLLAVEDANASAVPPADLAVWRPSTGVWWVLGGQGSQQTTVQWGLSTDKAAPGDYDGDGKTDFCVFRPSEGNWYIQPSSNPSGYTVLQFGQSGDQLAQADYDGDGKTDIAFFRSGVWYIQRSTDYSFYTVSFGLASDIPVAADYDGDGKADIAVWREGNPGTYYILRSSDSQLQTAQFGQSGDKPVPGDYDGDGKADYALRSGADWDFLYSSNNQTQTISWQQSGDEAVQNDYDGDGKVDIAVWRASTGTWYIRNSADSSTRIVQWGVSGDIPVPAIYRR